MSYHPALIRNPFQQVEYGSRNYRLLAIRQCMDASNPEKMDKTNSETGYCGRSLRSSPKPNRPGNGKCYTASAVDRSHSPDQATATNPWRSFGICIPGRIHQVLETSPPYCGTRYALTLASRHLPFLLETQVKA